MAWAIDVLHSTKSAWF